MKAVLVRIGVDQAYGDSNAPVNVDGQFVYVPIPEKIDTRFHPGLERRYNEVQPALERFCADNRCDLCVDLKFPKELFQYPMHLDPDIATGCCRTVSALDECSLDVAQSFTARADA